ncbi:MAG: hypothetical protein ACXVAO_18930, partial [Vulcanimicrobiaceae bacterium]
IVITHLPPGEATAQHHLRIVLLATAVDTADPAAVASRAAAAAVQQQTSGDSWDISADVGGNTLQVTRSLTDIWRIFDERSDGRPLQRMTLGVNGVPAAHI